MARILARADLGDGRVVLSVDVAVDTIAVVTVPAWLDIGAGSQAVADAVAARYAARRGRPRRGTT